MNTKEVVALVEKLTQKNTISWTVSDMLPSLSDMERVFGAKSTSI